MPYKDIERITREELAAAELREPRHYAMTRAVVAGLLLEYPLWFVIGYDLPQIRAVVRAVACLDQETPIGAKSDPACN